MCTYDLTGNASWLVTSANQTAPNTLQRHAVPVDRSGVRYTVNGESIPGIITREIFVAPGAVCIRRLTAGGSGRESGEC